ncbi:FUSC family protein [Streptacidiphilus monticola]
MADYARRLRHDPLAGFDPDPLMVAREAAALTPRQARLRPADLGGMRALVERMRPVLAALADPRVGAAEDGPERDRARELLAAAAEILDAAARSIRTGHPVPAPDRVLEALALPPGGPVLRAGPGRRAAQRLIGLLAQTNDALESPADEHDPTQGHLARPSLLELLPTAFGSMRRNWTWDSPILRHAVRCSVVVAAVDALGRALPFGHGYWAPLTAMMVMRPDFSQTYSRGVARLVGTVLGVGVGTAVMVLARPAPGCAGCWRW